MIYVYERLTIGLGDGIMLRAGINANIAKFPLAKHIIHGHPSILPIFADMPIEVVPFNQHRYSMRQAASRLHCQSSYPHYTLYELSRPCATYESENAPMLCNNGRYERTGRHILLSRQQIWCDVIGVPFDMDNYKVRFFEAEESYAHAVLKKYPDPIIVHAGANDKNRNYTKMHYLIEYVARRWGNVIVIDKEYRYNGLLRNVYSLMEKDIRKIWCLIAHSRLLVGIDSFGIHAAGSAGIDTYGIFGMTDPECRMLYPKAHYSPPYDKCPYQYCWYQPCKDKPCINRRSPAFYWQDIKGKVGL